MEKRLLERAWSAIMSIKNENHTFVENQLNITLDNEYANFLDNYGDYQKDGVEIYGYSSEYEVIDKIPCVIGATNLYKNDYKLSSNEIVIAHTNYEDRLIVLDNKSGKLFEVSFDKKDVIKIADSFNDWFSRINA